MHPVQALQVLTGPDAMLTDAEAREAVNTLGMLVVMLDQLCPCDKNAGTTDGPEQECPLHGDGVTFVTLCRWRDAVVAAGHTVNDTVADAPGLIVVQRDAWVRLRDLLNAGPWSLAGRTD